MVSVAVIGSGFSGAVIAHELSSAGIDVTVYEERNHIGGNCFTERDAETNIMTHAYGPHIFHCNNKLIWDYIGTFDLMVPYINRVKAVSKGKIYSLPINLHTINSFFGLSLSPNQARKYLANKCKKIACPSNFEEQALAFIGVDLYEAFFKGYTQKQWGVCPTKLPASVLKRLPVRFSYDDNYYSSIYQGIPVNGYTYIFNKMLDKSNITIHLSSPWNPARLKYYDHVFFSGQLDAWFGYCEGMLSYRTLDFKKKIIEGDYQGNAVINYCDKNIPWTRISEHKHFSPWEKCDHSVVVKEYSRAWTVGDIPYYPMRLANDKERLQAYVRRANKLTNVTFIGRLGTYRYLDMHMCIEEALKVSKIFLRSLKENQQMPAFCE